MRRKQLYAIILAGALAASSAPAAVFAAEGNVAVAEASEKAEGHRGRIWPEKGGPGAQERNVCERLFQ